MLEALIEFLRRNGRGALIFVLASALAMVLGSLERVKEMESRLLDKRFQWREGARKISPRLVHITMDAQDEKSLGPWPWSPSLHAQLLAGLTNETTAPAAIAYCALLPFSSQKESEKAGEKALAGLLKNFGNVCIGGVTTARPAEGEEEEPWLCSQLLPPLKEGGHHRPEHSISWLSEPFRDNAHLGLLNLIPDHDGIVRSFPLLFREGDHWLPSFALQTVMLYNEVHLDEVLVRPGRYIRLRPPNGIDIGKGARVPELRIPVDENLRMRINYRAKWSDFPHVAFQEALDWASGKSDDNAIQKILASSNQGVLVISKTTFDRDLGMVPTPLEVSPPIAAAQLNAINNMMNGDFLKVLPRWAVFFLIIVLCELGAFAAGRFPLGKGLGIISASLIGYLGLSWILFNHGSVWIPWIAPLSGLVAATMGGVLWKPRRFEQQAQASEGGLELRRGFAKWLSAKLRRNQRSHGLPPMEIHKPARLEETEPAHQLSLEEILERQGPLPVSLALLWLKQAAMGLRILHGKSSLHHDLRPENILFDASADLILLHPERNGKGEETSRGENHDRNGSGAMEFMSPEQINNEKNIDLRSDFYSMGIIFYQMLTGVLPFRHDSPGGICKGHLQNPIPPLLAPPTEFSRALDLLIAKMAAKEKEKRFQTADELLRAIEPWIKANPLDAKAEEYFHCLGLKDPSRALAGG